MSTQNNNLSIAEQYIPEITQAFQELVIPKLSKKEGSSPEQGINKYLQQGLMNSFLHSYLTPFVTDDLIQKYATQEKIKAQLKKSLSNSSTQPKYIQLWDKYFEEIKLSGKQAQFEEKMLEIIRGELKGKHHKSKHFKDYSPNLRLLAVFNLIRIHSLPQCSEICDLWFRCFGKSIRTRKSKHQKNKEKIQEKSKQFLGSGVYNQQDSHSSFEINEDESSSNNQTKRLESQQQSNTKRKNIYVKEEEQQQISKKQKLTMNSEKVNATITLTNPYIIYNQEDMVFHSEDEEDLNQSSTTLNNKNNFNSNNNNYMNVKFCEEEQQQQQKDDLEDVNIFEKYNQFDPELQQQQSVPQNIQIEEAQPGLQFDEFLFSCSENDQQQQQLPQKKEDICLQQQRIAQTQKHLYQQLQYLQEQEMKLQQKLLLQQQESNQVEDSRFAQQLKQQTLQFAEQELFPVVENNNNNQNFSIPTKIEDFSNIYGKSFLGFSNGLDLDLN